MLFHLLLTAEENLWFGDIKESCLIQLMKQGDIVRLQVRWCQTFLR